MSIQPIRAVVMEQKSKTRYKVELEDGKGLLVALSGKYVINGVELSEGANVFIMPLENKVVDGYILTATDFKINNWSGWTDRHEPKI